MRASSRCTGTVVCTCSVVTHLRSWPLPRSCASVPTRSRSSERVISSPPPRSRYWAGLGEPARELLAVVGEHLVRDPELVQRIGECPADGAAGRTAHHRGDDAEPGMIVHPGD